MSYNILTEMDFFKIIENIGSKPELSEVQGAYHKFVTQVIDLCHRTTESREALHALVFAETELQYHPVLVSCSECVLCLYVKKALAFIRKMMRQAKASVTHAPPIPTPMAVEKKNANTASPICWTGNAVDLVEMVYGICVMGSVNDGDVKFKDLAQAMYQFFGIKAKDCYRFYTDIRRRKNHSRTYFLDRMQEKLNDKMRKDDELERMRR